MRDQLLRILKKDDLHVQSLPMVSTDGPNMIYIKLLFDLNDNLKSQGHKGLLQIGMCSLHIVHNSSGHAMNKLGH